MCSQSVSVVNILMLQLHTCTHGQATKSWAGPGNLARVWACEAFRAYRARVATCRVEQWACSASLPLSSAMRTHTTLASTWPGHMCTCGAEHDLGYYNDMFHAVGVCAISSLHITISESQIYVSICLEIA